MRGRARPQAMHRTPVTHFKSVFAKAISLMVTLQPISMHHLRKGRWLPRVRGARISCPLRSSTKAAFRSSRDWGRLKLRISASSSSSTLLFDEEDGGSSLSSDTAEDIPRAAWYTELNLRAGWRRRDGDAFRKETDGDDECMPPKHRKCMVMMSRLLWPEAQANIGDSYLGPGVAVR